jgi:hypothetical protein
MATLARRNLVDILLIEASARIAATALREALYRSAAAYKTDRVRARRV